MAESIVQRGTVPANPEDVFDAWLDGERHAAMTGAAASGRAEVGARFTAWDGYIEGTNRVLERPSRFVQAWRTSEFPPDAPDSELEVRFTTAADGTLVEIVHTNLPDGQGASYQQGWIDHYLEPMRTWFGQR